jgi:hypothetical protein
MSDSDVVTAVYVLNLPSNAKAITAFSFASPAATGTIDESAHTIAVTVPYGTAVTALIASFTTTGASVTVGGMAQESGTTANNFTSPVTYKVTAADASTQDYLVTVTVTPSPAKAISAFSFASPAATGVISDVGASHTIAITVHKATLVTALVAIFSTTGVSVTVNGVPQTSGVTANNFSSPVAYRVTAADGSMQDYIVTVKVGLTWTTFTTTSGLANNYIHGIYLQGTKIWAATEGGLSYSSDNGTSWSNYTVADGDGLGSNQMLGIFATGSKIYAPSYTNGLQYSNTNGSPWATYNVATNLLGSNRVFGVAVSVSGSDVRLYAATNGGLSISPLNPISTSTFTNYTTTDGLPVNGLRCVVLSGSTIYVGSTNGLSVSNTGGTSWTTYLSGQTILSIYVTGSTIFAASNSGGLHVSTNGGTNWTTYTTANGLGSDTTTGVYVLGSTVYVSTFGGLSFSTDACATWATYITTDGLASNSTMCVFASGQNVYVGTGDGGLSIGH